MVPQQQAPRKKLVPRKPEKSIKKRRAVPINYGKEEMLTKRQYAWAHSLTISLSGWRSRQKFYKDHLKAHNQTETESKAAEAEHQARELPQCVAEEEEAVMHAILQAEAEEEKAEAWAHKAWEMHLAGRGVRKERHEYLGWDSEEEEYARDLEKEKLIAERRAKRKARRKAEIRARYGDSDEEDSSYTDSDDTDLDSSGDLDIVNTDAASRSPSQAAPVIERGPVVDWREKARTGVIKKKLSVTKGWSAVTWNQKSNIQERLLVLEEDGYDIRELLDEKATSEQVSSVILERAAAKQQSGSQVAQPAFQPVQSALKQEISENLSPAELDPALIEPAVESPDHVLSPDHQSSSPTASSPRPGQAPQQQFSNAEIIEDNTQPFSFDEPYYPQTSRPLKRKRDDDTDSNLGNEVSASSPAYKKRKFEVIAENELVEQALQGIKRAVFYEVFRSARSVDGKAMPPSRVIFLTKTSSVGPRRSILDAPSLDYLHPGLSKPATDKLTYSISTCAMDNMIAELRFLTNTTEEDSAMNIYDPDYDVDSTDTPVKSEERTKLNRRKMQRQSSRVAITKDDRGNVVIQGDAITLAELLKVLGDRELLQYARWEWDGLRLQHSHDLPWYLSPQTRNTLIDIENRLLHRSQTGGVEVIVNVVANV